MDRKSRQQALDNISAEDLEKIKAHQASTKGVPVDPEWMLLAEFGLAYGWDAYKAARDDEISAEEMLTLLEAKRRLEAKRMFEDAQASFIGAGSAQSKKPSQTFKAMTKSIIKRAKADE